MKVKQIIVQSLKKHGDGFWNNEEKGPESMESNLHLVDDIIEALRKDGLVLTVAPMGGK